MAKQSDLHFSITATNDDLKRKLAESRQAILDSGKTAEATASRIDGSFKRMASGIAAIGGGLAVGMMAKQLYSFANAFDKSMKEVSTISKTVTDDMTGFKNSILEMTTEIPVGADEAAKALYQIVSAGHDGAAGMQVLEVAAKAAIGGVTQTVTAADAITTVLNAYKKDATEAEGISDQLFTTVRLGKTTFGGLGQSISQAVPIAASFGIETEQVLAAVATLTKSGTPTAQAMTQIRASIVAASKALGDGYFQTHTFQEGLVEIANRAGGSESELRKLVPEIEAVNGVLGLTGINAKMAASDLAELRNSAGATGQAYAKMNDQADAQLKILKNTILKKFYDIGAGAVDVVGGFAKLLNSDGVFNDKAIDDVIATLVVLIATVGMYKASMMAANAIARVSMSVQYSAEAAELLKLLPTKQASANADIEQALAKGRLSQATAERLIAIRAEVQAELESLRVKAQTLAQEAAAAAQTHQNALRRSVVAKQNMALAQSQIQIAIQGGNADEIAAAQKAAQTAKLEKNSAAIAANTTRQALGTAQSNANSAATAVDTMQTNVNSAATRSATTAKNLFTAATARLTKAFHSLKVAFATNPIGMILTGVTMAVSLFSMFGNKVGEASNSFGEFALKIKQEQDTFKDLKAAIESTKEGTKERADVIKLINQRYPEYLSSMLTEKSRTEDIISALTTANEKIIENIKLKLKQSQLEGILSKQLNVETNFTDKLVSDYSKTNKTPAQIALFIQEISAIVEKAREGKATFEDARSILISLGEDADRVNNTVKSTDSGIARRLRGMHGQFIDIKAAADEAGNSKQILDELLKTAELEEPNPKPTPNPDKSAAKDYSAEVVDVMLKGEQLKLEVMRDGRTKELAQIEQTRKEKLAAIDKEQKEIEAKLGSQGKKLSNDDLSAFNQQRSNVGLIATNDTAAVNKKYDDEIELDWKALTAVFLSEEQKRGAAIEERYDKERKRLDERLKGGSIDQVTYTKFSMQIDAAQAKEQLDALTADYQTYADQRKTIEEKFNADISALQAKNRDGSLNGNVAEAEKQKKAALSKVNMDESSSGVDFTKLFGNLDNLTLPSMETLRAKIKAWIDEAGNSLAPEDLKAVSDAFQKLEIKIADKDPFAALKSSAKEMKIANEEIAEAQDKLAKSQIAAQNASNILAVAQHRVTAAQTEYNEALESNDPSMILSAQAKLSAAQNDLNNANSKGVATTKELTKGERELTQAQEDRAAAVAKANAAIGSVADKGKQIIGAAQDVLGIMSDLGVQVPQQVATAIEGLGMVMEGLSSINLNDPLSIVTGAVKIIGGLVKTITAILNGDGKRADEIERLQSKIDATTKSYEKLEKAIDKAYSTDASKLLDQSNELLEKQNKLIEKQKEIEQSKKDPDNGALEAYDKAIEDNLEKIAENKEKAIDAIFGSDLKSAIDDFASAYMDAWASGEDRATSQKDVVKNMIEGVIQEMVKSNIGETIKKVRDKIKAAMEDGIMSEQEFDEINNFVLNDQGFIKNEELGKANEKWLKDDTKQEQNKKSLTGAIRGTVATEASVAELGGIFRGQYDKLAAIDTKMTMGMERMLELARSNAAIEANTALTAANTAQTVVALAGGFASMQSELQAINKNTSRDNGSYGN